MWLWLGFHFSFLPYWIFFFFKTIWYSCCWLGSVAVAGHSNSSSRVGGDWGGGVFLSLNKRCKKEKNESDMSTGASWQTLPACLAASYSFGTVFWMNVNLLKKQNNVPVLQKKQNYRLPVSFFWPVCGVVCSMSGLNPQTEIAPALLMMLIIKFTHKRFGAEYQVRSIWYHFRNLPITS